MQDAPCGMDGTSIDLNTVENHSRWSVMDSGAHIFVDEEEEGRRKQPDPVSIVAELCHICNSSLPSRRVVAITLGANRAPIDSVRAIQNASSGRTGWAIAEHLHRMGHTVICIAGKTSVRSSFTMPNVQFDGTPQGMLSIAKSVASGKPRPEAVSYTHLTLPTKA